MIENSSLSFIGGLGEGKVFIKTNIYTRTPENQNMTHTHMNHPLLFPNNNNDDDDKR